MANEKERTSISGRHATGNAHQRAFRKKQKETYPIHKGENITEKGEKSIRGQQCLVYFSHF